MYSFIILMKNENLCPLLSDLTDDSTFQTTESCKYFCIIRCRFKLFLLKKLSRILSAQQRV